MKETLVLLIALGAIAVATTGEATISSVSDGAPGTISCTVQSHAELRAGPAFGWAGGSGQRRMRATPSTSGLNGSYALGPVRRASARRRLTVVRLES